MLAEVVRPRPGGRGATPAATDEAFAARRRLRALRDALLAARPRTARARWKEPALFFFHRERQLELESARATASQADRLSQLVATEVQNLARSVEARQAARAVPGLLDACRTVPQAKPLAELLDVPDDESVLVLHPERRTGFRFSVRGVATVNQFHVLMLNGTGEDLPSRFTTACRELMPSIPAGVPMVAELPYQCFRPAALQRNGSVPEVFRGCDQWLWGWEPLAAAPRVDGERIILLGEPAYPQAWEVERRFPAMEAAAELQDVLSPFQVAERLSRIAGVEIPVHRSPAVRGAALAAAA